MKPYLLAVLGAFSLTACAQTESAPQAAAGQAPASPATTVATAPAVEAGSADERARDAIRKLNAQIRIEKIGAAPLAGFREVIVGGQPRSEEHTSELQSLMRISIDVFCLK